MDNNDILIRLRYALDIKDADMVEVFRLGGLEVTKETVQQMLKNPKKDEELLLPPVFSIPSWFLLFQVSH